MLLQGVAHEDHIAERLAHLLAVEPDQPAMHPEAHERMHARHGLALRDLGGMVREDQVAPAAVDVELRAEVMDRHRCTLDVPARASHAPWARPARLARRAGHPQHEVKWVFFVRVVGIVAALVGRRQHLGVVHVRQLAVARVGCDAEVDVAVAHVGVAKLDQPLDDRAHSLDLVAGLGEIGRRNDVKRRAVVDEALRLAAGDLVPGHTVALGALEQRVVDVGNVLAVAHLRALKAQIAHQRVEDQEGVRVADMGRIVGRYTTDVQRQRAVVRDVQLGRVPSARIIQLHNRQPAPHLSSLL